MSDDYPYLEERRAKALGGRRATQRDYEAPEKQGPRPAAHELSEYMPSSPFPKGDYFHQKYQPTLRTYKPETRLIEPFAQQASTRRGRKRLRKRGA